MSEPFKYSTDTDFKSRLEYFEEHHPSQDLGGLTDKQIDDLLAESEKELAALGVDVEAFDASPEPSEAPVSEATNKVGTNLSTGEMRALLVANGVPVGKRGRLSPDQIAKAISLSM